MRQTNNLILFFILVIFTANCVARDITLSPQTLGERILHATAHSPPLGPLRNMPSQYQQGIDYERCTSSDSRHIHTFTFQTDNMLCLIVAQDRKSGKITGVALSGPHTATPPFRHAITILMETVSSGVPQTALQSFHFRTFLTLHEWYNSSTPVSIGGFNYSYYSDGLHRIFTLTSHGEK